MKRLKKISVFKEFSFCAAHYLDIEGHKCSQLHGHNYKLRIEVCDKLDQNNMVIDFAEIKKHVQPIIDKLDHQNLNEVLDFMESTTSEDLCVYFYSCLYNKIEGLSKIEIRETDTCGAILEV